MCLALVCSKQVLAATAAVIAVAAKSEPILLADQPPRPRPHAQRSTAAGERPRDAVTLTTSHTTVDGDNAPPPTVYTGNAQMAILLTRLGGHNVKVLRKPRENSSSLQPSS